jgi:hypothetical protein
MQAFSILKTSLSMLFTEIIAVYSTNQTQCINKGGTSTERQIARATKYCTMMTNIRGTSVRNLLNVILLVPKIMSLLLWSLKKFVQPDINSVCKKQNF